MAWDTSAPATLAIANQYVAAINERRLATGTATQITPAADNTWIGQNGHKTVTPALDWYLTSGVNRWNWWEIQRWIELVAVGFVKPVDYDGEATIPANFTATWTENATPADNNNDTFTGTFWDYFNTLYGYTGWRAKRAIGDAFSYRRCRNNGDIGQGAWIYEDLRRALKILVHTKKSFAWSNNSGSVVWNQSVGAGSGDSEASRNAAVQGAIDTWIAVTYTNYTHVRVYSHLFNSLAAWYSMLIRRQPWGYLSGMYASLNRDVDWYAFVEAESTFDAQGDGVTEDRFKLWTTDAGKTGAILTSTDKYLTARFPIAPPNWVAYPGEGFLGYKAGEDAADRVAIIKWNVTGGFTYP